jgi:hypothetical protein
MRQVRAQRSSSADASAFLDEPAVKFLGAYLREHGYVLTPRARLFQWACGDRTVRLVWRHRMRSRHASVVLSVVL